MAYKRFTASVEQLRGDPRYDSKLAAKFINCLMYDGKRSVAQRVFYDALDLLSQWITAAPAEQHLRTRRAELLEQVGLPEVSEWDRRTAAKEGR